jgi:hypothetical protein
VAQRTAFADGVALTAFAVIGVLIRAAIVGHWAGDFYGIALAFTLLFVLAARTISQRL